MHEKGRGRNWGWAEILMRSEREKSSVIFRMKQPCRSGQSEDPNMPFNHEGLGWVRLIRFGDMDRVLDPDPGQGTSTQSPENDIQVKMTKHPCGSVIRNLQTTCPCPRSTAEHGCPVHSRIPHPPLWGSLDLSMLPLGPALVAGCGAAALREWGRWAMKATWLLAC